MFYNINTRALMTSERLRRVLKSHPEFVNMPSKDQVPMSKYFITDTQHHEAGNYEHQCEMKYLGQSKEILYTQMLIGN